MKKNKSTIRQKLLLVAIMPAACLAVLLSFYFIIQRSHDIETSLRQEMTHLAEYIAKNSEFDLITGDFPELENSLKRVSGERAILYIKVLDKDGKPVAFFDKRASKTFSLPAAALKPEHVFETSRAITITSMDINDYQIGGNNKNTNKNEKNPTIGRVIIGATNIFSMIIKRKLEKQALLIIAIAIILTIIIATTLAQTVSKPLTLLAQGMEKIKAGNLKHRIKEQSTGEIGLLEKNINEMASSLDKAQAFERRQAANLLQSERIKAPRDTFHFRIISCLWDYL